jgi:hypothetical protein
MPSAITTSLKLFHQRIMDRIHRSKSINVSAALIGRYPKRQGHAAVRFLSFDHARNVTEGVQKSRLSRRTNALNISRFFVA